MIFYCVVDHICRSQLIRGNKIDLYSIAAVSIDIPDFDNTDFVDRTDFVERMD